MKITTTITAAPVPALLRDAAARMALWANVLPGWCDQDEPAARVLQTALGIMLVPEEIDKEDEQVLMTLRLVDDKYFDDIEDTKRRFRYRPRLVVARDDIEAAGLVIQYGIRASNLSEIAPGKRWRATTDDGNAFLSDWSIIKRHLIQHLSFREIARDLGLDEAGIRRRFHKAIASISAAFGPIQWPDSLSPHQNPYSRRVFSRTGQRPVWHHKLHIHVDRPDFQSREQALAAELELAARFVAAKVRLAVLQIMRIDPAIVQVPDMDEVIASGNFSVRHNEAISADNISGQHCTCYGPDDKILWTVSRRPQPAYDNAGSRKKHRGSLLSFTTSAKTDFYLVEKMERTGEAGQIATAPHPTGNIKESMSRCFRLRTIGKHMRLVGIMDQCRSAPPYQVLSPAK
jgi:hypothetical protein